MGYCLIATKSIRHSKNMCGFVILILFAVVSSQSSSDKYAEKPNIRKKNLLKRDNTRDESTHAFSCLYDEFTFINVPYIELTKE